MLMRIEEHCGVTELVQERETEKGTKYQIAKWTCPTCAKPPASDWECARRVRESVNDH